MFGLVRNLYCFLAFSSMYLALLIFKVLLELPGEVKDINKQKSTLNMKQATKQCSKEYVYECIHFVYIHLYVCIDVYACLYIFMCTLCVQVPMGVRMKH